MKHNNRFLSPFKYALVLLTTLGLVATFGCSRDPEQRMAYKEFLREQLAKQDYTSPESLTADQEATFGSYALSYKQLYDFSQAIEASVEEGAVYMADISENISSPKDIMGHREDIAKAREFMILLPGKWDGLLEKAKTQKAELSLHEEIAPLYDQLFVKYTDPLEQIKPILSSVVDTLNSNFALAEYLKENEGKIQFQGNMIICNDEALHERFNQLLADMNAKAQALYILENSLSRYKAINKK